MTQAAIINPFLATVPTAVTVVRREQSKAVYAKLPQAPVTGSPVPELTSLYHNTEPGPYGDRSYPGNCPGNLIKDLLRFFKPGNGYGGKGAYRGGNITRRVFGEIMQGNYVAQKLAVPGERAVYVQDAEMMQLKYDVRCYVYDGQIQIVAARLYQGQTTNFRMPGGGFALVHVVE